MKGKYICIEGPDGGGKSTLAKNIVQHLEHHGGQAVYRWFPSDNPMGSLIRQGLRGELKLDQRAYLYLFCADGLQANELINDHLNSGRHVICDRHPTLSGRVFQPDHHTHRVIEDVYGAGTEDGIRHPDKIFVLDVPPEVSLQRMQSRSKYKDVVFESDDIAKVADLRDRYLRLAKRYDAIVLDGQTPAYDLVDQVVRLAELQ